MGAGPHWTTNTTTKLVVSCPVLRLCTTNCCRSCGKAETCTTNSFLLVVEERKHAQLILNNQQLVQLTYGTDSPVARMQQVYDSSAMMMSVSAQLVFAASLHA